MTERALSPHTVAVSAGRPEHIPDAPLNAPITMAATFVAGGDVEYGRSGNPTWTAFEDTLGALEGGQALGYSSGLAAVATLLDLVAPGGTVVAPRGCYNGVLSQLFDLASRGRLRAVVLDPTDTAAWVAACAEADLVWLESPTNPMLHVMDLSTVIDAARAAEAYVAVDNTFATPLRQRPLSLGADLVVHSVTKYLAGHSDLQMGAIITADPELYDVLRRRRELQGAIPGAFESWLALRGVRTLGVRLDRSEANATELANRLAGHCQVSRVRYPGWGGIVSVEFGGDVEVADRLTSRTTLWTHATSLGGVESTFERRRRWKAESAVVPEDLVRLSVGIEDVEDLWADLTQALT
ncbi:MAG TPA: PLP-dependent transferase [Marmoricola sp.]|nr:PLP-dependent transferase [Marmoricola sp.]